MYLTLEHLPAEDVRARFPLIADLCRRVGLDLATDRLPVSPAAHYVMGGVVTDLVGRTSLPGLYAAGEVACTGVHGANRLASNSLLEGLVFGGRAAAAMCAAEAERWPNATAPRPTGPRTGSTATVPLGRAVIADLMWQHVGVFRDRAGLETALAILEPAWRDVDEALAGGADVREGDWQAVSLVTIGRLVARAALRREESRGGHWRTDFPARDDLHWCRHLTDCRE